MAENDLKSNRKHYVRAAYAPDGPGADSMLSLLKEHGIDAFRQGGTRDIYRIGGDIFGEEIMVAPEDLSSAQSLLEEAPGKLSAPPRNRPPIRMIILSTVASLILFVILLYLRGRFLT